MKVKKDPLVTSPLDLDMELDEAWENELRKEEKNLEKELQRQSHVKADINLTKRFLFLFCFGILPVTVALFFQIVLENPLIFYYTNVEGKLRSSKAVDLVYLWSVAPLTYFIASVVATIVRFALQFKKENTRLLIFYWVKVQKYFVLSITGAFGLLAIGIYAETMKTNFLDNAVTLFTLLLAWGVLNVFGAILFRFFSIKFVKSAYFDRVLDALFTEYVLVMLSRPHGSQETLTDQVRIDKVPIKEKEIITRDVSELRLAEFVSFLQESPYFLVHTAQDTSFHFKKIGKSVQQLLQNKKPNQMAISARALGHKLFSSLKPHDRDYLNMSDFKGRLSTPLIEDAFLIFDKNYDGALEYNEFMETVSEILKERRAISDSLNDAENALLKLESAFKMVTWFIFFFVSLYILGADVQATFTSLTTTLVGFAFVFGPVVKSIIEGIIFVFVSHPYDISDRIVINEVMYTVMRLNMYNTVLRRHDNAHVVFPNSEMAKMEILNLTKSMKMVDIVEFNFVAQTTKGQVEGLKERIGAYLKAHPKDYLEKFEFSMSKCEDVLSVQVRIAHRHNFHNMIRYRDRRTRAIMEMMQAIEDLDIKNRQLPLPYLNVE